jgi:serine/threonine protein kinase
MEEGRYQDWKLIGQGGTANVYRAVDSQLEFRAVAIKLLREKYCNNEGVKLGLRREVLISWDLRHPNICPIHGLYEGPRGFGIVMEFIEGQDLRGWMDDNKNRLLDTIEERLTVLIKIADALIFAHTKIIHRDLKPANIYLSKGDIEQPLIMDFGISIQDSDQSGANSVAAGTLKYAPPEQFLAPETVDRRADIYSFGMMAYELLTAGKVPPCSLIKTYKNGEVARVAVSDIEPPSRYCDVIPPDLDRIVLNMLHFDPEARPPSAQSVYDVLVGVEFGRPPPPDAIERAATISVREGEYFVGSGPSGSVAAEKPMRRVVLSAYGVSPTTITNDQYRQFMERTGNSPLPWMDRPEFGGPDQPAVGATWDQAMAFAKSVDGRLPTEIEWEVAAKGGQKLRTYPWGEEVPDATRANIGGICNNTTSVFSHKLGASPDGLMDMCGNVWEWCLDEWDPNFYRQIANLERNPRSHAGGSVRSVRGGSFESFPTIGRCSSRYYCEMDEKRPDVGFRVVYDRGQ